jgi:hypothetical protein
VVGLGAALLFGFDVAAQESSSHSAADLAKQLQNPVADLISIPFQFNWEFEVGPETDTRYVMNLQAVMPFNLNPRWNLIARVIAPYVGQPVLAPGGVPATGWSDLLASFFFSPNKPGLIWGVGPAISLPATSEPTLGSEKWSAGPTGVALHQAGSWTVGGLANQIWSFAGDESRSDVNQTFLQPFVAHSTKGGGTITLQSETTANWMAPSGEEWTIPIIVILSKVTKLGRHPISIAVGAGYFVEKPAGGPDWKARTVLTLLLPK